MRYSLDKTTPLLPGEEFRPHPKWPFDVSNLGRVRSQKTGRFVGRIDRGNKRRATPDKPYIRVTVTGGGTGPTPTKDVYAHVLVLETFVSLRPGPEWDADHINRDRLDNCVENLQWRLASENRADITR